VILSILSMVKRGGMHGKIGCMTKSNPEQNALSISLETDLILIFEVVGSRGGSHRIYRKE
jgi:hypothetical protein